MTSSMRAKRAIDLVGSLALATALSPVCLVVAALIKLEDGGPVLYRQFRAGANGVPFPMNKFRSMKVGAPASPIDTSEWVHGVPDDFVFKTSATADARITRCGRWLRRTSLDELPQLLNVIVGDMSLVGPRPEILPIAERYNQQQGRRLTVKPGLTGLAQVRGRADSNHGDKILADIEYVDTWALSLDLRILIQTVFIAVSGRGAH